MCLAAGVWILLQFTIFAGDTSRSSYSYSFYLTLVAFLLSLAAGVCFLLAKLTAKPRAKDGHGSPAAAAGGKVDRPGETGVEGEEVKAGGSSEEAATAEESTHSKLNGIRAFWKHPRLD